MKRIIICNGNNVELFQEQELLCKWNYQEMREELLQE